MMMMMMQALFAVAGALACRTHSASQSGEEALYMARFMPQRKNGTFVEIGALDGHKFSNTRVLSKCMGWSGLLVEANIENYAQLVKRLDRPNVQIRHSAVCEASRGWTSFTVDGGAVAVDTTRASKSFQAKWARHNHPNRTVQVPCAPMRDLLLGYESIDFFSLDVEGAEETVVRTIDFERVSVDTFCIEMDGHDPDKNARIAQRLAEQGYTRCAVPDARNGWFRKRC